MAEIKEEERKAKDHEYIIAQIRASIRQREQLIADQDMHSDFNSDTSVTESEKDHVNVGDLLMKEKASTLAQLTITKAGFF